MAAAGAFAMVGGIVVAGAIARGSGAVVAVGETVVAVAEPFAAVAGMLVAADAVVAVGETAVDVATPCVLPSAGEGAATVVGGNNGD